MNDPVFLKPGEKVISPHELERLLQRDWKCDGLKREAAFLRERVAELEGALNTVFTLSSDAEAVEAVCVHALAKKGYDHYTAGRAEEAGDE